MSISKVSRLINNGCFFALLKLLKIIWGLLFAVSFCFWNTELKTSYRDQLLPPFTGSLSIILKTTVLPNVLSLKDWFPIDSFTSQDRTHQFSHLFFSGVFSATFQSCEFSSPLVPTRMLGGNWSYICGEHELQQQQVHAWKRREKVIITVYYVLFSS